MQKALLALHSATRSKPFLKAAVQFIQAAVPCDLVMVILHYPGQYGRSTTVWRSDGVALSEEYLRASYANNPTFRMLAENPGLKVHRFSDMFANEAEMEAHPFFIKFTQAIGVRHASALMFWDENVESVDCAMVANRGPHRPDFDAQELETLGLVHGHIETAYQRVNQNENELSARNSLRDFVTKLPFPTVLLDWKLNHVYHNSSAREACARWNDGDAHVKHEPGDFKIPPDLVAAMQEMQAKWSLALRMNPLSTTFKNRAVNHTKITGLHALLEMTTLRSPHFGKPSFLIHFEQEPAPGRATLASLTRLTPQERRLVELVCEGRSNQEIADALGRSLSTVKSGLYSVFKKLNIASRSKQMKLLG